VVNKRPIAQFGKYLSTNIQNTVLAGHHIFNLGILRQSLRQQFSYLFTLTAGTSSASILVTVIGAPRPGVFTLTPTSGSAMVDVFTFATSR
jgi:hypothetical protein